MFIKCCHLIMDVDLQGPADECFCNGIDTLNRGKLSEKRWKLTDEYIRYRDNRRRPDLATGG